jgi:oxygen-independent coproporphyrinogen-3 oxidase
MESYVASCVTELHRARDEGDLPDATSVFFGGGTPSRLPADLLVQILEAVPRRPRSEVTVECNPEDVGPVRLEAYREAGVTRISLGVQSTVTHVLEGLGRRHGSDQALESARAVADAGFATWNMDLIMGGSGERPEDWVQTLEDVLGLESPPPHLSAYSLTVEPGTPLAAEPDRHPDEDAQALRYEETDRILSARGYRWEEISNWARPGHECRHNGLYWDQGDYRGIGSAAHSHRSGRRWWNVRTPDRYVAAIQSGRSPLGAAEELTPEERRFEALALGLRTRGGVPEEALPRHPDLDGLVDRSAGRAVLTVRGRLLANAVTAHLVGEDPTAVGVAGRTGSAGTIRPYA